MDLKAIFKDIPELKETKLWEQLPEQEFNKFLLKSRVIPFLQLKILESLAPDDIFEVGRTHVIYTEFGQEQEDGSTPILQQITINNQLCKQTFSTAEIWDFILENLAIEQLITDKFLPIQTFDFECDEKGPDMQDGFWETSPGDLLFYNKEFILTTESIFINKDLTELIEKHRNEWKEFLEEEHGMVDHEKYIVWLQKSFPGKIKIRMLQ